MQLGLNGEKKPGTDTYLLVMLEEVHCFGDEGAALSIHSSGSTYSFNGEDLQQNWSRIGVELERKVSANVMVSISVNASSKGQDPDYSCGFSVKGTF